jgi:hypothetical protein
MSPVLRAIACSSLLEHCSTSDARQCLQSPSDYGEKAGAYRNRPVTDSLYAVSGRA